MPPETKTIFSAICVFVSFVLICGIIKFIYGPSSLNSSWVGTTFYVFKHEHNIAEMIPVTEFSPYKKNKGRKFYIPESFGVLEPGKTYELLENESGDLYVKKVALMLG